MVAGFGSVNVVLEFKGCVFELVFLLCLKEDSLILDFLEEADSLLSAFVLRLYRCRHCFELVFILLP